MNKLSGYVKKQMASGYSEASIKQVLSKYGYTKSQIEGAFENHSFALSKTAILIILAVVAVSSLFGAVFLFYEPQPKELLDLRILNLDADEDVTLTTELINLGSNTRYDVSVRYEVFNKRDQLITFEEETLALQTKASTTYTIEDISPGSYYVKVTALDAKASKSFVIKASIVEEPVVEQITPEPVPEPLVEEPVVETTEQPTIPEQVSEPIVQDSQVQTSGESVWDKINNMKNAKSRDQALENCNSIDNQAYRYECITEAGISLKTEDLCAEIEDEPLREDCFKNVADETNAPSVCQKITKDSKKDQCYMSFVNKGDYSHCDQLSNKYLKQSCESLKRLSESS